MSFVESVKSFWNNYANFKGRASRSEYWFSFLFILLANIVVGFVSPILGLNVSLDEETTISVLSLGWLAAYITPWLAVTVRRLHDSNKSGWFFFVIFFPLVGVIVHIVFMLLKSTPGANKYGEPPAHIEDTQFNNNYTD